MSISPQSYAFLLEHHYKHVQHWVLTGQTSKTVEHLLPILEDNAELISAWVHHNHRHDKMLGRGSKSILPVIGLVEFAEQLHL